MQKMIFEKDLPFDFCEECIHQDFDLDHEKVYAYDKIIESRYVLFCRNSSLCKYITSKLQNNEIENRKGDE